MATSARKAMMIIGYMGGAFVLLAVAYIGVFIYLSNTAERPKYTALRQDGPFEIREYPDLVVAEVSQSGSRGEAVRSGFGPLAGYIFAKERPGERISMTAPMTQQRASSDSADGWAVRFIMPAKFDLASLPKPANSEVRLIEKSPAPYAAIRFSGAADDALMAAQERKLRVWLGEQRLEPADSAIYAYYDHPSAPGPLRRNEVLIELKPGERS